MGSHEILSSALQGIDSLLISYGSLDKSKTMIGSDDSLSSFGLIPLTIIWLYKLIDEHRVKHSSRFTVKISILEVLEDEKVFDLLKNDFCEDNSISKTCYQLKVSDMEKALYYFDTALANRKSQASHLIVSLGLQQHVSGDLNGTLSN